MHLYTVAFLGLGAFLALFQNLDAVFLGEILSEEGCGEDKDESKEDNVLHIMIRIKYRFTIFLIN